jgi:hypothetical protein
VLYCSISAVQLKGLFRLSEGIPEEKRLLKDPNIDGRIILRWIFKKCQVGELTDSSWLRIGTGGGHF